MRKKWMSLLLAVCMLVPLAPAEVFAAEPTAFEMETVADGDSHYAFQDPFVLGSSETPSCWVRPIPPGTMGASGPTRR